MRNGKLVHVPAQGIRIGPLKKGLLGSFGYKDVKYMTEKQRHAALYKAIKKLGPVHVERSLYAIATLSHNPTFKKNADWVRSIR